MRRRAQDILSVTRGHGFLEGFLARQRAKMADRLIPQQLRNGTIADVGCGNYPFFLLNTEFKQKIGLDKIAHDSCSAFDSCKMIQIINYDVESESDFPLAESSCDVITMLAVIEHLEPAVAPSIFKSIFKALRKGGVTIITTPAFWTDKLLRSMAVLRLVSKAEIDEHKIVYKLSSIEALLVQVGFNEQKVKGGLFELGMNLWVTARKD